jgi:hypothetical protein
MTDKNAKPANAPAKDKQEWKASPTKTITKAPKDAPKPAQAGQRRVTIEEPKFDEADQALVRQAMLNRIQSKFQQAQETFENLRDLDGGSPSPTKARTGSPTKSPTKQTASPTKGGSPSKISVESKPSLTFKSLWLQNQIFKTQY